MLGDYGCDDMEYLIRPVRQADTVEFTSRGSVRTCPSRFDNRKDKTTFVRVRPSAWKAGRCEGAAHWLGEVRAPFAHGGVEA